MAVDIQTLLRRDITQMESYTPIVPFEVLSKRLGRPAAEIIKLDANENPYGPSPKVYAALANERHYHIYPDPDSTALRQALAGYLGVDATMIMAGHGADELIDLILRLFLQPGDAIVDCPPTFGMYSFDTDLNHGRVLRVPRRSDFTVDVAAVERGVAATPQAKVLFLTSPNNPDGGLLCDEGLRHLLDLPLVVVLDEAYIEFGGASRVAWVEQYPNLVVLRTFSKWAGLAGLRVGYGVVAPELIEHLWKIKQPYNVNVAGTIAALASLDDVAYLMANVARLVAERERLAYLLGCLPFLEPYPSHANFVLCRVVGRDARTLKEELAAQAILVRHYDKPGLRDHLRFSVGRPKHTDALFEALYR